VTPSLPNQDKRRSLAVAERPHDACVIECFDESLNVIRNDTVE